MKKKIIALSALSFLLFSGCTDSDDTANINTSSAETEQATATPTLTVKEKKIIKEYGTEAKDPLVELLKPDTAKDKKDYLLEKKEFLAKWKETKGTLIDLRTPAEIKTLPMLDASAKNFNFYSPTFAENFRDLDRDKTYFIYCAHGNRSASVYKSMKAAKFTNVFELKGGITAK